ncbi:hypothetical protein [Clostridium beijerinckii]|uniref:hypothetical protein n=1 Tax=Clostridium beijerinckii TaxID=1520 RepID=UPI0003D373EF|nr:hypothetical protein [Clostridium beijerinckii]ALB44982.1 hypothetical protein X276_06700 [Clostridium beijerinckii NRRL B-598]
MLDFLLAALPWVVMGIAIAFAVVSFSRKKDKLNIGGQKGLDKENSKSMVDEDDYMSVEMCLGICFGSVFSLLGLVSLSYGISFGMLIGMVAGIYIKKK